MKRIWAAAAASPHSFSISLGALSTENPRSFVVVFDDRDGSPDWTGAEVPRSIMSLAPARRGEVYMALSDEGDVYCMEGDVPVEKIPGAGAYSSDAIGLGTTDYIVELDGRLHVCGSGAQVYQRRGPDDWQRLADKNQPGQSDNSFESLARLPGTEDGLAVCGFTRTMYRQATEEELSEIQRIKQTGTKREYRDVLRRYTGKDRPAQGCLYLLKGGSWSSVELPNDNHLHDVAALDESRVIAVGSGGVIVAGAAPEAFEDHSVDGLMEKLRVVRPHGNEILILGDTAIHVLDQDLVFSRSIALPEAPGNPNRMEQCGDTTWYFGYKGVARFRKESWEEIEIPERLWARAGSD